MKELNRKDKDTLEFVKQQIEERQKQFLYTKTNLNRNHIIFEVDLSTGSINEAKFEEKATTINWQDAVRGNLSTNKEVVINEGSIYLFALNRKSVMKQLRANYGV
jgi:hypothetical protein